MRSKKVLRVRIAPGRVLTCVRPSNAAICMPLARMGFADRAQYTVAYSRYESMTWFFRSRLSTLRHTLSVDLPTADDGLAVLAYAAVTGARYVPP